MGKTLKILGESLTLDNVKWHLCDEELPGMPPMYKREEYLCCLGENMYMILAWCGGWSCSYNLDGTINRKAEIEDVIAWMPIPKLRFERGEDE